MPTPPISQFTASDATVRMAAYEYVFFLTVRWYAERHAPGPAQSFAYLKDNQPLRELTASKLLLFPFYFATANGHTEALIECMGEFYAHDGGPIPHPLLRALFGEEATPPRTFPHLTPLTGADAPRTDRPRYGLALGQGFDSWDQLEGAILDRPVDAAGATTFRECRVPADVDSTEPEATVSEALFKSARIIKAIEPAFVDRSVGDLDSLSRQYRTFRHYLEYAPNEAMAAEFIRKDRKVYAPTTEVAYVPAAAVY